MSFFRRIAPALLAATILAGGIGAVHADELNRAGFAGGSNS